MKLLTFNNPFPYSDVVDPTNTNQDIDPIKNFWNIVTEKDGLWDKLLGVFNLSKYEWNVFWYIQYAFNVALSVVAFIALIVLIYYFYMILFSKDMEWTATAKKALKWVIIALLVMWFSRLIVSFMFWVVKFVQG